ncbi:hypothetical protein FHG87_021298 [Trinorchestia longiramus]|nr:hypothetical protein FHG87_021298 [Trinorchestia longiramus]
MCIWLSSKEGNLNALIIPHTWRLEDTSPTMPPELQELYALYQQELQYTNVERDTRYLNELNSIYRSPSMLSLRSAEHLPPIRGSGKRSDPIVLMLEFSLVEQWNQFSTSGLYIGLYCIFMGFFINLFWYS